ncbi:MAG: HDOD domain-containing protein [Actinobacteria bacterium]|nr:HDOD domain-containing protein [Actinomycetota bacterium]MCG2800786.1 HDOD domain-containing protein [Cellulomonas sp.]
MATSDPAAVPCPRGAVGATVAVALQRIEHASGLPLGHELLFRPTATADASGAGGAGFDDDAATAGVLAVVTSHLDLADIAGDGLLFVNLPRSFIVGSLPLPLPPGRVVLELLERVDVDEQVRAGLVQLRADGYLIALDDLVLDDPRLVLAGLADFLKVDLADVPVSDLPTLGEQLRAAAPQARLVAERIETEDDRARALAAGFTLLQGYLLSRPAVVSRDILAQHAPTAARLLSRMADPSASMAGLAEVAAADPGITVRVLRAVNNVSGVRLAVSNLTRALALLGRERLRQLLVLDLVAGFGHQDDEMPVRAVARTRAAQLLCPARPEAAATEALVRLCAHLMGAEPSEVGAWLGLPPPEPAVAAACDALDAYLEVSDREVPPPDLGPYAALDVSMAWFTGMAEGRELLERLSPGRVAGGTALTSAVEGN